MYEIDKMPQMIDIGYTGEIEFRTVQIDMSAWVSQMPDATPTLMHIRPGETEPYPVEITYSSNIITWNVTDGDLGTKEGTGLLQVWFGVADEEQTMRQLGMSAVVATLVHLSIAGEGNNSATVQLPWLREVTEIKNLILGYDYEAESWANGKRGGEDVGEDDPAYHNNSKYYCEQVGATALDSEAYAIGTRAGEAVDEDDPAYHNNSKYYDEQAALEKAAAQAAAETASAAYNVNLLAPNYDATATYKVGDYVIYSGGYYRCISAITTAEAWTAAHWSQVTVGADVSSLKSALGIITDGELLTDWIEGKRISTNSSPIDLTTFETKSAWDCYIIDCNEGDIFTLTGNSQSTNNALWCWCQANGTIIAKPSGTLNWECMEIQAPTGAKKLVINVQNAYVHWIIKNKAIGKSVDDLNRSTGYDSNLLSYIAKKNGTDSDISVVWNENGSGAKVTGTKSSLYAYNIYSNASKLPTGIKAGNTYRVILQSENVYLRMIYYDSNGGNTSLFNKHGYINELLTIPSNAIGLQIMLRVPANTEVDEMVYPFIYTEKSEAEKYAFSQNMILQNNDEDVNIITTLSPKNKTTGEVTFIWNIVDMSCAVSGTATSSTYDNIYYNPTSLPNNVSAGGKYIIACDSDIVRLRLIWYDSQGNDTLLAMTNGKEPMEVTIPAGAVGLAIRLHVSTLNVAISETVYAYMYAEMSAFDKDLSKKRIGADVADSIITSEAKFLSVGNSFMTGAVWISGSFDHYASYKSTVYGQFAMSLNVPNENVTNIMESSGGIIRKGDNNNNFEDIIKTIDLSDYDYLLTMMSGSDMANYQLGDINATADDGTIAGAVVAVVNYLTTSNGMCKLILLCAPPYSSNLAISGENTFTGLYGNGKSLTDLDELMFAMAKKYHFTYISWQDNPMSYHYMDFADYIGDNQGSRHANSDATYRAMGEYAALQMRAVNSPIALKMISELT